MTLDEFFKKFNKEHELMTSTPTTEDEHTYRDNLRNNVVGKLNLPDNWRSSLADEKRFNQDAPAMIAGGTMGTITPTAKFGKILSAVDTPMANAAASEVRAQAMAHPDMLALQADKSSIAPSAYDNKKQAIFDSIRKKLGGY